SLLAGVVGGRGWWAMTGLIGVALLLNSSLIWVDDIGARWVAAATLLAYAPLASVPLSRRWLSKGTDPALAAALAGPAMFLPLYRAWEISAGDTIIGMLPALLGAVALLNAAILVRLYRTDRGSGILAVFVGVALLGVSAAIPLQLDQAWLTVAWAVEAAALAALTRRLSHPLLRVVSIGLLTMVGIRLLLNPAALTYGTAEGLPILNWTLYTWGLPLAATLLSARWLHRPERPNHAPALLRLLACALGFMLINVQVSHAFQSVGPIELGGTGLVQGMVRSLAWAAYGGGLLGLGLYHNNRRTRLVGFAVVMLATAKVFAFDLWALEGLARVGSAMGLGLTLLTAAFLFERLVLRQPAQEDSK
ncbi:MAG: putative membrane protein, partial [Myxococcota bacterium]